MKITDVHTHIFKLDNSPFQTKSFEQNLELLVKEMKRSNVSHALVFPAFKKKDGKSPSLEKLLSMVEGKKNLFVMGSVNATRYTKNDLAKLRRLLLAKKIRGMKLYPGYQHFYPNEKKCYPIYELCEELDIPVMFHSGDTLVTEGYAKVKYAHPLHIDDVACDFPDLKIIVAHLGNPWMVDCAELLYKNKNVYADLSGLVVGDDLQSAYGRLMRQKIRELIIYSGAARKLLYGTDWPLTAMRPYIQFVKSLGLSKIDQEFVFHKNAEKLFKI